MITAKAPKRPKSEKALADDARRKPVVKNETARRMIAEHSRENELAAMGLLGTSTPAGIAANGQAEANSGPPVAFGKLNGAKKEKPSGGGRAGRGGIRGNADPSALVDSPAAVPPAGRAGQSASSAVVSREASVSIHQIVVSKKNPRSDFDEAYIDELAASIQEHGLLQSLVVRALPEKAHHYELIAGECRLRACKKAGRHAVEVKVLDVDERTADKLRVIENLHRRNLNAIEEARGFQSLCAEHGYTHDALAAELGCSQGHVTSRIGLLKLPKAWQDRIITRELPPTHGRAIIKYAAYPEILKQIEKDWCEEGSEPPAIDYRTWEQQVETAAEIATKQMSGRSHVRKNKTSHEHLSGNVPNFNEAQRAGLKVIKIGSGKQAHERAANVALWEQLCRAAWEKQEAKAGAKREKEAGKAKAKEKTPAERCASQAKLDKALREWIENWRTDWLRRILSALVLEDRTLAGRAVLMGLAYGSERFVANCDERVEELIEPWTKGLRQEQAVAAVEPDNVIEVLAQVASEWVWNDLQAEKEPGSWHGRALHEDAIEALAESAKIDLAEFWAVSADDEAPYAEQLFNRHTTADLVALCEELKVKTGATKKTELVAALVESEATWKRLPKAIKPVAITTKTKRKK